MIVTEFSPNFYILDDQRVREFLIIGEKEAILIDTGFADTPIMEEIQKLTCFPIKVILTHGDHDHTGGLKYFNSCYFHKADETLIQPACSFHYLKEGEHIDIGQYHFEVIEIPGHTRGSIALFEKERQWLIVGDTVQKEGPIYMFGKHRHLDSYIESLKKLQGYQGAIQWVLPSHHECPISPKYITYCLEEAKRLRDGKLLGTPNDKMPCSVYQGQYVSFYY